MTDTKETQALEVPNSPIDAMKLGFTQLQHRNRKYYNQGVRQALQSQAEKDRVISDEMVIAIKALKEHKQNIPVSDFTPKEYRDWDNEKAFLMNNLWTAISKTVPFKELKEHAKIVGKS